MKVREIMTPDPVCCTPEDSAQKVATMLRNQDIGSMPVVMDQSSRKLVGVITDRDLCCSVVAQGLDPADTKIDRIFSLNPVTCRDGENVNACEELMQRHQIRRVPIVDGEGRCIGILSQADVALHEKPEKVSRTVAEISRPAPEARPSIAA
ncbi:MAG TPA: CBS domain-containing protein [Candidatus Acidoferrales bacterium]|jgi:CBS domain-containing protein|nr:CBS domain-containing protein [Candidatus Acidoferrales bacterium]